VIRPYLLVKSARDATACMTLSVQVLIVQLRALAYIKSAA